MLKVSPLRPTPRFGSIVLQHYTPVGQNNAYWGIRMYPAQDESIKTSNRKQFHPKSGIFLNQRTLPQRVLDSPAVSGFSEALNGLYSASTPEALSAWLKNERILNKLLSLLQGMPVYQEGVRLPSHVLPAQKVTFLALAQNGTFRVEQEGHKRVLVLDDGDPTKTKEPSS